MNVLIKESQPLTAFGIHQLLEKEFKNININMVTNLDDVLSSFNRSEFDMFIIDTELNLFETEKLIKSLRRIQQNIKILIYGNEMSSNYELHYISMGANGFITKQTALNNMVSAIKLINANQVYISQKAITNSQIHFQGSHMPIKKLSRKEYEVYKLLVKGFSVNKIAHKLSLKQTTISTVKRRILVKMKVSNIAELVLLSTKIGNN